MKSLIIRLPQVKTQPEERPAPVPAVHLPSCRPRAGQGSRCAIYAPGRSWSLTTAARPAATASATTRRG